MYSSSIADRLPLNICLLSAGGRKLNVQHSHDSTCQKQRQQASVGLYLQPPSQVHLALLGTVCKEALEAPAVLRVAGLLRTLQSASPVSKLRGLAHQMYQWFITTIEDLAVYQSAEFLRQHGYERRFSLLIIPLS